MLVTVAIIAILAVGFMTGFGQNGGKSTRKDGLGTTIPGAAKAKTQDTVCVSNLSQVRQLIMVAQSSGDDTLPPSLDALPGAKSVSTCPIGGETYLYDSKTGKVTCPHPGHENY